MTGLKTMILPSSFLTTCMPSVPGREKEEASAGVAGDEGGKEEGEGEGERGFETRGDEVDELHSVLIRVSMLPIIGVEGKEATFEK